MRPQPYPKYKPSGVEWLGEVPEHWKIPSLYLRYQVDLGKMLNETGIRGDHLHPYLRNVDVQWNHINVADLPQIDIGPWEIARFTVRRGDLLVCEGGEVGRAALVQDDADCLGYQKALHRLRPVVAGEDPRFMLYTLYGAAQRGVFVAEGNPNTIAHLTGEKLRRYRFPTPPAFEQSAIADFLDGETAKIDTLVAKKRTLIERLNEKRAALISRTVTRGLPPDAACAAGLDPHPSLKPSGIDWLGDVPEHWELAKLSRVTVSRCDGPFGSGLKSEHYTEGKGIRVVRLQNIRFAEFDDRDIAFIEPEYYRELGDHDVFAGDVLIAGLGDENNPVGRACVAPPALGPAMVKADCFRFRVDRRKVDAAYVALQLSATAYGLAGALASGTTRSRMNLSATATRVVAIPPLIEQISIVSFLSHETAEIDSLITKLETAIERLHEYRAALITEAVTGKIDVRGAVVPEEDAA